MGDDDLGRAAASRCRRSSARRAFPRTAVIVGKEGLLLPAEPRPPRRLPAGRRRRRRVLATRATSAARPGVAPPCGPATAATSTSRRTAARAARLPPAGPQVRHRRTAGSPTVDARRARDRQLRLVLGLAHRDLERHERRAARSSGSIGNTGELRAYDAVPAGGNLTLRFRDSYGAAGEVPDGRRRRGARLRRLGRRQRHRLRRGHGRRSRARPLDFGTVTVGQTGRSTATITANQNLHDPRRLATTSARLHAGHDRRRRCPRR